jgi:hypothetical protein
MLSHLQQIPIWWRWYYWASPVAWTLYGLVSSQVGDNTSPMELPGRGFVPVNYYIKEHLGFNYDFLGAVAAAHIGFALSSSLSLPMASSSLTSRGDKENLEQ